MKDLDEITLLGEPMGKPRMTQRDKWQKRACVVRYREWADALRVAANIQEKVTVPYATSVVVEAYFSIPPSWPATRREMAPGTPHTVKPDGDNVLKAVLDALVANDQAVFRQTIGKYWDDGFGPRVEISFERG